MLTVDASDRAYVEPQGVQGPRTADSVGDIHLCSYEMAFCSRLPHFSERIEAKNLVRYEKESRRPAEVIERISHVPSYT